MRLVAKKHALVVLALAVVAATAGCSGSPDGQSPSGARKSAPELTAVPTITPGAYVALPLDAYALSDEDAATVTRALGILEQKCMAKLGFTAWRPAPVASTPKDMSSLADFPLRPATRSDATTVGYRKPPPPSILVQTGAKPSDAEMQALFGFVAGKSDPPADPRGGGCSRTAFDELNKGRSSFDEELFGKLKQDAADSAKADSRMQVGYAAWSACMKQAGFEYATPADAVNHTWTDKQAGSLEIATATADIQCREQSNLIGVWVGVVSAYEQRLIDENSTKLAATKAAVAFEVEHAAAVVAASS